MWAHVGKSDVMCVVCITSVQGTIWSKLMCHSGHSLPLSRARRPMSRVLLEGGHHRCWESLGMRRGPGVPECDTRGAHNGAYVVGMSIARARAVETTKC